MRILLVEDEPTVQSYIMAVLEKADHVIVRETNGTKALRRYSKEGPFDLVLTDIEHKGMDGVELMHAVHKKNRKQSVGIITGWPILQKPFNQRELLKFARQLTPR
jgi:two-component system, NtrC family, C4-dicarboxylate transport response regulator DctD